MLLELPGRNMWPATMVAKSMGVEKSELIPALKALFPVNWREQLGTTMLFRTREHYFPTGSMRAQNASSGSHIYDPQSMVELLRCLNSNSEGIAAALGNGTSAASLKQRDDFIKGFLPALEIENKNAKSTKNLVAILVPEEKQWLDASPRAKCAIVLTVVKEFMSLGLLKPADFGVDPGTIIPINELHPGIFGHLRPPSAGAAGSSTSDLELVDAKQGRARDAWQHLRGGVPPVFTEEQPGNIRICPMLLESFLHVDWTAVEPSVLDSDELLGKYCRGLVLTAFSGFGVSIPM